MKSTLLALLQDFFAYISFFFPFLGLVDKITRENTTMGFVAKKKDTQ